MNKEQKIFRLTGHVQHYDWGGFEFIPALLDVSNSNHQPFAEYWLGTHRRLASGFLKGDQKVQLSDYVQLPYLFKVLDVREMLSIQVHPSKKAAEIEFARENTERIPLDASHRNYQDDNHKPELAIALGDFWILHGFKKRAGLVNILKTVPEFSDFLDVFEKEGYEGLYKTVMGMPQEKVNETLSPLLGRIIPLYQDGFLKKYQEDYWAAKAAMKFNRGQDIDRGIFSVYFFNLVCLKKGEGIFQPAGVPHAYLEGRCVEIMANSDNVLRGGLTSKHIDIKELMKHVKCGETDPNIVRGDIVKAEKIYNIPVDDFCLSVFELKEKSEAVFKSTGTEIIFAMKGNLECASGETVLNLKQGEAAVIFPGQTICLKALPEAEIYRASGPRITN